MKELATNLFIGAIVGSLFTIITNSILEQFKRKRIKRTIKPYLLETIKPQIKKIKEELTTVTKAIEHYNSGDVTLGMHPTFNSSVLKSFNMTDLQSIYKKNFNKIINIIGYLDNLEKRLPHFYLKKYVDEVDDHLEDEFEKHLEIYKSRDDHFHQCPTIIALRTRTKANLKNVDTITDQLRDHIDLLLK